MASFLKIKIRVFGFGGKITEDNTYYNFFNLTSNTKDITLTTWTISPGNIIYDNNKTEIKTPCPYNK